MSHKTLLLFSTLVLSGCVERGFDLTVNKTTHTITATKTVDMRDTKNTNTQKDIDKMNIAVLKEQKENTKKKTQKIIETKQSKLEKQKELQKQKELEKQKELQKENAKEAQKKRDMLLEKQSREKEQQRIAAEQERKNLSEKAKLEKIEQEKKEQLLQTIQNKKKKEALKKQIELENLERIRRKENLERIRKSKEEKLILERKLAAEKERQIEKEKAEKIALEKKLAQDKLAQEKKLALALQAKKDAAEKMRQKKIAKEKAVQAPQIKKEKQKSLSLTQPLVFRQSQQTYQKFGTSEIHGHVVYIMPSGQEIGLKHTKIYLVPKNSKIEYWYENYYLKNKEASSSVNMIVEYINATHLNVDKNFAFYGLATGTYYIIIESSYPSSIAKNKKVYIAKKINVEKYKKIMTVFSKKL